MEVVEPDDRQLVRDGPALVVRGMEDANRREVGRAGDRGRGLGEREQRPQGLLATGQRVWTTCT